jgi:hypothetical protein
VGCDVKAINDIDALEIFLPLGITWTSDTWAGSFGIENPGSFAGNGGIFLEISVSLSLSFGWSATKGFYVRTFYDPASPLDNPIFQVAATAKLAEGKEFNVYARFGMSKHNALTQ